VAAEHEGKLVLVDGFARQRAAVRLGLETLLVLELTPVQMKAQLCLRNRERGMRLLERRRRLGVPALTPSRRHW
jgi:hypothetical protein